VGGAEAGILGGNGWRGFAFGVAGSILGDSYAQIVGHEASWQTGQSYPALNVPCSDPQSNCYLFENGFIPENDWTKNTFGLNVPLTGDGSIYDCFVQSGACSRFFDQGPGLQAVSQLHDTWMNALPGTFNFPTMPFAAAITYGALTGNSVYNFNSWLHLKGPF